MCALCFVVLTFGLEHPLGPKPAKPVTTFGLADDSHLLGTSAMASVARVSDETLYNWHSEGCPCDVASDGTRRWNKDAVLAWREKNRPAYQLKGGKRQGAGRKRGTAGRVKAMVSAGVASEAAGRAVDGDVIQRGRMDLGSAGGVQLGIGLLVEEEVQRRADQIVDGWGEMKNLMALVKSGGLSAMESATLAKAVEAQAAHLKLQKERGELVEADDVKTVWTTALSKIAEVLNQTPDRAAAHVVRECGLRAEDLHAVRTVLENEMRRACEMVVRELGEGSDEGGRQKAQSTEHT